MERSNAVRWDSIERWSPRLFLLAGMFLVIAAVMSGMAFLGHGQLFDDWLVLPLELGRLAALIGTLGLSVQLGSHDTSLGKLGRGVAMLAIGLTVALTASALLTTTGLLSVSSPALGIAAFVLSVSTFLLYGLGILRTRSHPTLVGRLLVINAAALLVVFFGRILLPLGLLATAVPGAQALLYVTISHSLRCQNLPTQQSTTTPDTTP